MSQALHWFVIVNSQIVDYIFLLRHFCSPTFILSTLVMCLAYSLRNVLIAGSKQRHTVINIPYNLNIGVCRYSILSRW